MVQAIPAVKTSTPIATHRARARSELEVEEYQNDTGFKCTLWTRQGVTGLSVIFGDNWIKIPRKVILDLIGSEYISAKVNHYDQMDEKEAITEMFGGHDVKNT